MPSAEGQAAAHASSWRQAAASCPDCPQLRPARHRALPELDAVAGLWEIPRPLREGGIRAPAGAGLVGRNPGGGAGRGAQALLRPPLWGPRRRRRRLAVLGEDGGALVASRAVWKSEVAGLQHLG